MTGYGVTDDAFSVSYTVAADAPVPAAHALHQNHPNPFGGATRIAFDLPEDTRVHLTLYDVSGRRVRTLVNGTLPAGYHEATWDGVMEDGRAAAAGVYFYRIRSGDFLETRRLILTR